MIVWCERSCGQRWSQHLQRRRNGGNRIARRLWSVVLDAAQKSNMMRKGKGLRELPNSLWGPEKAEKPDCAYLGCGTETRKKAVQLNLLC